MSAKNIFHLSLPALDLETTKEFYVSELNLAAGRMTSNWFDIDLFGNQITFTSVGNFDFAIKSYAFEHVNIPSFHFGILMKQPEWEELYERLKDKRFMWMQPYTFLESKIGQHDSFFIQDPNGYIIEFKTFKKDSEVFLSNTHQ